VLGRCAQAFLVIVGGDPEQVETYRRLAVDEGIADDCCFIGRVAQQQAVEYASLASVQVSPRTEGTNTPLKIYQQLASGIPLVATDIYSHTQVLDSSVAFLAEAEPQAFADAMIRALSKPDHAREVVENALRLYEEQYSRQRYVAKLRKLLAGLK
jgi:glycosyltransferase involved in cell wall biosynthesis